jgi:hypothetical protein
MQLGIWFSAGKSNVTPLFTPPPVSQEGLGAPCNCGASAIPNLLTWPGNCCLLLVTHTLALTIPTSAQQPARPSPAMIASTHAATAAKSVLSENNVPQGFGPAALGQELLH